MFILFQEKLDVSPRVDAAYKEVFNYQDLLLMADLANINPGTRPLSVLFYFVPQEFSQSSWLDYPGTKLANFKLKLPGGKMRAKSRPEVVAWPLVLRTLLCLHQHRLPQAALGYKTETGRLWVACAWLPTPGSVGGRWRGRQLEHRSPELGTATHVSG